MREVKPELMQFSEPEYMCECGYKFYIYRGTWKPNYCAYCGSKLDWSDYKHYFKKNGEVKQMNIKEIIAANLEMEYEIYLNKSDRNIIHTDSIEFIANSETSYCEGLNIDKEKLLELEDFEYEIMDKERYESSVLANAEDTTDGMVFPILVISIKEYK